MGFPSRHSYTAVTILRPLQSTILEFKRPQQHTPPMNRSDLVTELAARFDQLTQRDVETAVDAIINAMTDTLVRGRRIEIRGFGSFSVNRQAPRKGRNPRSGESVAIPEKRVTHFKPGKALREDVDGGIGQK